jgi:hypothetical protein
VIVANESLIDLFKTIVWDNLVQLAINDMVAAIPFATVGFASYFTGPAIWILTQLTLIITNQLYKIISMLTDLGTIKLRNAIHQQEFDSASEKLSIILTESGPTSQEFINAHNAEVQNFWKVIAVSPDPLGVNS